MEKPSTRWTAASVLPVGFVAKIVLSIWGLYVSLHLLRLLQSTDVEMYQRGVRQVAISHVFFTMMSICFLRAVFTHPGSVPKTDEWTKDQSNLKMRLSAQGAQNATKPAAVGLLMSELKQTGERRFCKWCNQYKPDRCHHCRVCKSCVLRMDHHCPWIANCVGFKNHKFFLLLVFYALLSCITVITTMSETLQFAIVEEMHPVRRFFIVYCLTLSCVMCLLLFPFLGLHTTFMLQAQTTIEHCEQQTKKGTSQVSYSISTFENLKAVLGPNVFFWLLPMSLPEGDGLFFNTRKAQATEQDSLLRNSQRSQPSAAVAKQESNPLGSSAQEPGKGPAQAATAPEVTKTSAAEV
jgi:hypothetical protein